MARRYFRDIPLNAEFTTVCGVPYVKTSSIKARGGKGHPRQGIHFFFRGFEVVVLKKVK